MMNNAELQAYKEKRTREAEARAISKGYNCAMCGGPLVNPCLDGELVARCGRNKIHVGFVKPNPGQERLKQAQEMSLRLAVEHGFTPEQIEGLKARQAEEFEEHQAYKQGRKQMEQGKTPNKAKAHIRYKDAKGNIVPGVTTVLGILNKPALVVWANRLGLQGIDSTKYRDEMADIGTLAHYLIMCYLKDQTPELNDYSEAQIDKAENCVLSFHEWDKGHTLKAILVEQALVSETNKYGGTIDLYCHLDGNPTLIDFKTGKGIYPEMIYQLVAYKELLIEAGYPVSQARILRIGRDEDEGFEEMVKTDLWKEYQIFSHCRHIYRLQKEKV